MELEEAVHPVGVAGEDHDEIVALVLHHLQQDLDRFLAVVALVLRPVEIIGLVDEQHAAHGLLQHFLGLRRGVADILADEIVARDRDEMAFADIAERVQDLGHAHRDRRLAGAGIAGEGHMQRRRLGGEADALAHPIDEQQRCDLADTGFDRLQANELAIKFVENRADMGVGELAAQIDIFRELRCRRVECCVSGRHRQTLPHSKRSAREPALWEKVHAHSSFATRRNARFPADHCYRAPACSACCGHRLPAG